VGGREAGEIEAGGRVTDWREDPRYRPLLSLVISKVKSAASLTRSHLRLPMNVGPRQKPTVGSCGRTAPYDRSESFRGNVQGVQCVCVRPMKIQESVKATQDWP